jgi:hypothetical protein
MFGDRGITRRYPLVDKTRQVADDQVWVFEDDLLFPMPHRAGIFLSDRHWERPQHIRHIVGICASRSGGSRIVHAARQRRIE